LFDDVSFLVHCCLQEGAALLLDDVMACYSTNRNLHHSVGMAGVQGHSLWSPGEIEPQLG
jgi:hypothetical protein